jgi:Rha family phage regulatory protein
MGNNIQLSANLVEINNQSVFTTSTKVAHTFGKSHKNVLRDIDVLIAGINEINASEGMLKIEHTPFKEVVVINQQNNQEYRSFELNRDGFALLAMGYTGKEALKFKIAYINQFNAMEQQLNQKQLHHVEAQSMLINDLRNGNATLENRLKMLNKSYKELDGFINEMILNKELPLTAAQQKEIQKAIHEKASYFANFGEYKRKVAFAYIWAKLTDFTNVPRYSLISRNQFDEALAFVKGLSRSKFIKACPYAKIDHDHDPRQMDLFKNQVVVDLQESIELSKASNDPAIKHIIIGKIERSIDKLNSLGFNKAQQITIN